jgi:hypothetical protein
MDHEFIYYFGDYIFLVVALLFTFLYPYYKSGVGPGGGTVSDHFGRPTFLASSPSTIVGANS